MEFKGTKGKWTKNGINGVHSENGRCVALTYQNDGRNDVRPYDALLISKAPELLELLEEVCENLSFKLGRLGCCGEGDGADHKADNDSYGGNQLLRRAKNLIKEATEL